MTDSNYTEQLRFAVLDDFDDLNRTLSLLRGISGALEFGTENTSIGQPAIHLSESLEVVVNLFSHRLEVLSNRLKSI